MAGFVDVFFLFGFVCLLVVFFLKLYNVLSSSSWYDYRFVWLLLIAGFFSYGFLLFAFLSDFSVGIFRVLFSVGNLFLPLIVLFTIVELFINLGRSSVVNSRGAYNSVRGGR